MFPCLYYVDGDTARVSCLEEYIHEMYYCTELACDRWEQILMAAILLLSAHAIFGDDDDDDMMISIMFM